MPQYSLKTGDYLSPNFRPELIANALIKDTTTAQDKEVDLAPALTRLKYDIEEIDSAMHELCRNNTDVLLEHARAVSYTTNELESLHPVVDDMLSTYTKLERDFLKPYERACQLRTIGERLFSAASLSRNLSWYLQLALQAQSQDYQRESVLAAKEAGDAMLRTARALFALNMLVQKCPSLLNVNAVSFFEQKVPNLKSDIIARATKMVHEFQPNESVEQIKLVCRSLVALGADLPRLVESHIRALVGSSVLQLTRNSSASPVGHRKAFEDVQDRESVVRILSLISTEISSKQGEVSLDGSKLYWELIATQLEQKLKTMSLANPSTMKVFISNKESILSSTQAVDGVHAAFKKYLDKP